MKRIVLFAAILSLLTVPVQAQDSGFDGVCTRSEVPQSARDRCLVAAQAVGSAQPQLGILVAGGNPTIGTASTGGIRLGVLPRVSATAKLNLVFIRLPDIIAEQDGRVSQQLNRSVGIPAPALSGTASIGVISGFDVLPLVGGIGSVDLLGTATWLPLDLMGVDGVGDASSSTAFGAGVRVGLLRESFVMPGVSASLMYRRLGRIEYGDVCPGAPQYEAQGMETGECMGAGDLGEFAFDLTNWSTRIAASKRLLGVGVTAGIGHDRYSSDVGFGFRTPDDAAGGDAAFYARARDRDLSSGRWSGFVNGSFSALVATFALEAGWMQGDDPLPGFQDTASDFDPGRGTFFGSLGIRVAL